MKKLLLTKLFCVLSIALLAQFSTFRNNKPSATYQSMSKLGNVRHLSHSESTQRTTSSDTSARCIARVVYDYSATSGFVPNDSVYYFYSGTEMIIPAEPFFDPNNESGLYWIEYKNYPDSAYEFLYNDSTNSFYLNEKHIYNRGVSPYYFTTLTATLTGASWVNSSLEIDSFNSSGCLTSDILMTWDTTSSSWVNSQKWSYCYTALNKVDTAIYYGWDTTFWNNNNRYLYEYNTDQNVSFMYIDFWSDFTTSWTPIQRDSLVYDGSGNLEVIFEDSYDTTSWTPSTFDSIVYVSGNLTSDINKQWLYDSSLSSYEWFDNYKDSITNNSYNEPVYWFVYNAYQNTTNQWSANYNVYFRFYYQLFINQVENIVSNSGSAVLYPVPASGSINLCISWQEIQSSVIVINDVTGKKVYEQNVAPCKDCLENLQLNGLSKGNYMLSIKGEKGNILKKFVVE